MAMGMEGDSNTPLGALVSFLAAEQPAGAALRGGTALVVLAAISVRCAIGLHPYSGMGKPPMFGDFEAQRHWMELTTSLPLADWYRETEQNDLQYWGLDYPPLTAYHSWVCGKVLGWLDPASMELATSRGYETPDHKTAMRAAVLVCMCHQLAMKRMLAQTPCAYAHSCADLRPLAGRRRAFVLPGCLRVCELVLSWRLQSRPTLDRRSSLDATATALDRPRALPIQRDLARPARVRVGPARQVVGFGQA
jgi:hypothetical protein